VFEPTGSRRDAAGVIFNLPGYWVIEAVDLPLGGRRVKVQPVDLDSGCPECGVVSSRVHAWVRQRVRDIPHAGRVEVVVRKPRLVCAEPACARRTFIPATDQLPLRARCTIRLRTALLDAVIDSGRAVAEVAADYGVAWWTVQTTLNGAAVAEHQRSACPSAGHRRAPLPTGALVPRRARLAAGGAVDVDHGERRHRSGAGHRRRPQLCRRRRLARLPQLRMAEPNRHRGHRPLGRRSRKRSPSSCPTPRSASMRSIWCSWRT
jgi:hypothetical protein